MKSVEWEIAFDKGFYWDFREIRKNPAHKNLDLWIKQFIKELLSEQKKEILDRLPKEREGELQQVPCPDGNMGCLVYHVGSDRIKSERDHGFNECLLQVSKIIEE